MSLESCVYEHLAISLTDAERITSRSFKSNGLGGIPSEVDPAGFRELEGFGFDRCSRLTERGGAG